MEDNSDNDNVDDMTDETPVECKQREDQAATTKCKERGEAKKFDEAVAAYDEAIAAYEEAAVYFTSRM